MRSHFLAFYRIFHSSSLQKAVEDAESSAWNTTLAQKNFAHARVTPSGFAWIWITTGPTVTAPAEIFQLRQQAKTQRKRNLAEEFIANFLLFLHFIQHPSWEHGKLISYQKVVTFLKMRDSVVLWNNSTLKALKSDLIMTIDADRIDESSHLVVNTSPGDYTGMTSSNIKVYKRRWYILFIFTLLNTTGNILWNTWPPIQETCQLVFGWDKTNVLTIGALQAVGSIISIVPSAWLLDTKGELNVWQN